MKQYSKKKHYLILFLAMITAAVFASDYYTGNGQEDKSFFMLEPVMKNVDVSERAWLPSAISAPLKSSLKLFTGMTPVNFENTAKIQEIQKKVESGAYDGSRAVIEAGMLQDANYGVFVTVTKTGSTYQLAVSITNLSTGREEATCSINNLAKATDLQDKAINAAIIKLAPQLGIQLTALGLYTLSDSTDGTLDEQISLAKQEAASYQTTIDALNRELQKLNTASAMTEQEALAKKAAAETEKQLFEQRQLAAQQKAERLLEQKQKAELEKQAATARSADANRKIGQLSSQAEEMAARVRAMQSKSLSVEDRITIIEKKKAAYMSIFQKVEDEVQSYWDQANIDYKAGYVDPDKPSSYPNGLYTNGVPNKDYRQLLINTNKELKNKLQQEAEANSTATRKATEETLSALLEEIKNDIISLSNDTFTISSLDHPEIFTISSYNTNKYSWNADIKFSIFQWRWLSIKTLNLSYEEITGETRPGSNSTLSDFETYAATYDIYDSMFRMGIPFLRLDIDYSVVSDDDEHPSHYFIELKGFKLIRTTDNTILRRETFTSTNLEFSYYPITDMSSIGQTVAINESREAEKQKIREEEARLAEEEARKKEEEKMEKAKRKEAEMKALQYSRQPGIGEGYGFWTNVTYSYGAGTGFGYDIGVEVHSSPYGLNINFKSLPIANMGLVNCIEAGYAVDFDFNLLGKKVFWFFGGQVGYTLFTLKKPNDTAIQGVSHSKSFEGGLTKSTNIGLLFPLSDSIALKTQYSIQFLVNDDDLFCCYDRLSLGVLFYPFL